MLARSVLFNVAVYANFLVQAVLFSPVLVMPRRFVWPVARFWVRSTLWLHETILGVNDDIRGTHNIPAGGCIVASKHQSAWETLRLIELFPKPRFILKQELLWVPLFGWYLARAGMIPVARGKRSAAVAAMTARARLAVQDGCQIIIFPEGTRRPPMAPPEYRFGVARLYRELGVACLPVALNSGLYWPRRALKHNRGTIVLECLEPIPPGLDPDVFMAQLKASIEAATAAIIAEALGPQPGIPSGSDAPNRSADRASGAS